METVNILVVALVVVLVIASALFFVLLYYRYVEFADEVERDALDHVMRHERIWDESEHDGFRD